MTTNDYYHTFWVNLREKFPDEKHIYYPEDYRGGEYLFFTCTQTSLPSNLQNKLIDKWCDTLPAYKNVKHLGFTSRINQKIFSSICQMRNLESIWIKWGAISNLDPITQLNNLKHLHLGSSTQIPALNPLIELSQLESLDLENLKKIIDFSLISKLSNLTELGIIGSMWTTQKINTISFISKLIKLKHLDLANTKILDKNIKILANCKSLISLNTPYWYRKDDFEYLYQNLPNLKYGSPIKVMTDEDLCERLNIK